MASKQKIYFDVRPARYTLFFTFKLPFFTLLISILYFDSTGDGCGHITWHRFSVVFNDELSHKVKAEEKYNKLDTN